jgi:hypothetical protein
MAGSKRSSLRRRRWRSSACARARSPPSTSRSGSCEPDRRRRRPRQAARPGPGRGRGMCARDIDLLLHIDGHRTGGHRGADLVLSELDDGFTVRALSEAGEAVRRGSPWRTPPTRRSRRGRTGRGVRAADRRPRSERRSGGTAARGARTPPLGRRSRSAASLVRTAPSFVLPASARACRWRRISMGSSARANERGTAASRSASDGSQVTTTSVPAWPTGIGSG